MFVNWHTRKFWSPVDRLMCWSAGGDVVMRFEIQWSTSLAGQRCSQMRGICADKCGNDVKNYVESFPHLYFNHSRRIDLLSAFLEIGTFPEIWSPGDHLMVCSARRGDVVMRFEIQWSNTLAGA